jgi:hypothetical protein
MTINQDILEKIAQIKKLADRAGTLGEAEAASAMLSKLLLKHQLELSDLDAIADEERQPVTHERVNIGGKNSWKRDLMYGLAQANLCKSFYYSGTDHMVIVGHAHNMIVVKELYFWLVDEIYRIAKAEHVKTKATAIPRQPDPVEYGTTYDELDEYRYVYRYDIPDTVAAYKHASAERRKIFSHIFEARQNGRAWMNSFLLGAVQGVCTKMREEREALKQEVGAEQWALVPVVEKEVEEYYEQFKVKGGGSRNLSVTSAYNHGYRTGQGIGTSRQVNGNASGTLALR